LRARKSEESTRRNLKTTRKMKKPFNLSEYAKSLLKKEPDLTKEFTGVSQKILIDKLESDLQRAKKINVRLLTAHIEINRLKNLIDANRKKDFFEYDLALHAELTYKKLSLESEVEGLNQICTTEIQNKINNLIKYN